MALFHRMTVLVAGFFCVTFTMFCAPLCVFLFLFSRKWGYAVHRYWGIITLGMLGIRIHLEGKENLMPGAILAPNHASMFDILVLATLPIDFRWISKVEVGKIPLLGAAMRAMGCYFVKRDKSGNDINVMKVVEDGLRDGANVVIFPEGTRTRTGEIGPFKKGAFRTAMNAGVPLLPIGISGTFPIAPPKKLPQKLGHRVKVVVGPPYRVDPAIPLETTIQDFRDRVIALVEVNNPLKR